MSTPLLTFVADREANQYVTIFDGQTLFLLENVSKKEARTALDAIKNGQPVASAFGAKAKTIPASDVTRVRTAEHNDFVQVRFSKEGADKRHVVAMSGFDKQLELVRAIGATIPNAEETRAPIPVWLALVGPGFATLCVIGITTVFLMLAREVATGKEIDTSGRRGGMKLLIANVLGVVGPYGVIGIGLLALSGAVYWGYKRIKSPPILTTFERPATDA